MSYPQRPPALLDRVDVYWPSCERYFRGTLVRAALPAAFTFFIFYDDNEYLRTNLNRVRWHYATDACCKGEQDILLSDDFVVGDMQRYFGRKKKGRQGNFAGGRALKRRRETGVHDVGNSGEKIVNAASDVTLESLEKTSELESSNKIGRRVAEEANSMTNNRQHRGRGGKDSNNITTNVYASDTQEGTIGDKAASKMDGREHWKKVMLAGYQRSGNA